jgi:hypothetical protein
MIRVYRIIYKAPQLDLITMSRQGNLRNDWVTESIILEAFDAKEAELRLCYRLKKEYSFEYRPGKEYLTYEPGPIQYSILDIIPFEERGD